MVQIIAAIVGIVNGLVGQKKDEMAYNMSLADYEYKKNQAAMEMMKIAEIIVPLIVVALIVYLIIKHNKK